MHSFAVLLKWNVISKNDYYIQSHAIQIAIGCLLLIKARYDMSKLSQYKKAITVNNVILWFIFGVTTINVFISAFGIDPGLSERKFARSSEIDSSGSDTSLASTAISIPSHDRDSSTPRNLSSGI